METSTRRSLVLLDELGKGTEPDDGAAIAAVFIERLSKLGCHTIFATCAPLPSSHCDLLLKVC